MPPTPTRSSPVPAAADDPVALRIRTLRMSQGLSYKKLSEASAYMQEVLGISGILLVKAFTKERIEELRFNRLNEELRELEGIARRQTGRRNVIATETLLCFGADEGAGSLGLDEWDDVEVDLSHPSLRGVEDVFDALVSGCSADVLLEA